MKKIIAWLLAIALTAAVSVGATLAYLTDTDEDVNVMTLGKVKIDQLEFERIDVESKNDDAEVQEFHDNKPLLPTVIKDGLDYSKPGDTYVDWAQIGKDGYTSPIWNPELINNEVDKMVFIKNKGDYDAYVRSVFAFEAGKYTTLDEFKSMVHLNLNTTDYTWEWVETPVAIPNEDGSATTNYFIATATYNKVLAPGALTEISLSQIALDKTATNADVEAFGETYQVLVKSQGIQADGFDDAADALDEGFGVITTTNVPWDNDAPTKGIDVRTALHYLDGDSTTTAITANVSSVTFGLNKTYASVVDANTGVLVDVEQDVPVYAYYVENGSNYDVYFLADDDIYLPKDSATLFKGMTNLTGVETKNLNVSRAETMKQLFRECGKLTTVNTTGWDTSKVTDMSQMFYKCGKLTTIPGIGSWDTGAVTTMKAMFRQSGVTGELNLSGWDVSNVTNMNQLFYSCPNAFSLNAEGWNTGKVTDMGYMFTACPKLQTVQAAGWNTSEVTTMYAMFGNCGKLTTLDATGWTNSKVTDVTSMFLGDGALSTVKGSGGWNFASATKMASMFEECGSLTTLDVTNWDLSKAEEMWNMFVRCKKLVTLTGEENWKLSNATTTQYMFQHCYALTGLDVQNWDLSNVTTVAAMFQDCYALEYMDPSRWNTGKCQYFNSLFGNCYKLKLDENALVNWDMGSAIRINHMFDGCGVEKLNLSNWDMPNLITTTHMFADCSNLTSIDFTGWNTPNLISMDCMFNDCTSLTYLDMSSFDTATVQEFSQLFERCTKLEKIDGLEKWDTSNGRTFGEMFRECYALQELNLTSFNTRNVIDQYFMEWQPSGPPNMGEGCINMFYGANGLNKLILSENFSFDGDGKVTTESYKIKLPAPAAKEGFTAKWQDVDTGVLYDASEIPEEKAATYVAYYEPIVTNP